MTQFRFVLTVLIFVTSVTTFACPTLKGRYAQCRSTVEGNLPEFDDVAITQKFDGVKHTFLFKYSDYTTKYVIKGLGPTFQKGPDVGAPVDVNLELSCDAGVLSIKEETLFEGENMGTSITKYSQNGSNLSIKTTGTIDGVEINDSFECIAL